MDARGLRERLARLARIEPASTAVVSVYLDTRWVDEHARERARIFLKNELRRVREGGGLGAHAADLDWVEAEGGRVVDGASVPEASGIALFACHDLSLREVLALRVPFEDRLVVAPSPFVLPLIAALEDMPSALVVFADTECGRLLPLGPTGPGQETVLEAAVPGHHSRGGWAQLAQSRYQRHIQQYRDRHFDAVAESVAALVDEHGVERVVLAGESRNVALLRMSLPGRIAARVAGVVEGARHEPGAVIAGRAAELLGHHEQQRQSDEVDAALTAAAKRGAAVAGLAETIDAVNRGAVRRLYVGKAFQQLGRACGGCQALATGDGPQCAFCGAATAPVELGRAMSDRVLAAGGAVEVIDLHGDLTRAGGIAALLRYPR